MLTLRSIEIIQGGKFLFDVLAIPDNLDLNHSWDCLDIAFHLAKTKNELFTEEELQKLNLTTHFRTLEDINEVLDEMSEI